MTVSIEAASAWIFNHCLLLEPKLYVESKEGSIPLDSVTVATRSPVRFPVTLPMTVSIFAWSA